MNRFPKKKTSSLPPDFDFYIPSGSPRGHSRPLVQVAGAVHPENPPAEDSTRPSTDPETSPAPESPALIDVATPESITKASPSRSDAEHASQTERVPDPTAVGSKGNGSTSLAPSIQLPASAHHGRLCTICSHPLRDAIEADFLRWRSPDEITREYRIRSRTSIYRHANAVGLFRRRKQQFARVLEFFLEQAETCCLEDANVIIRAARIYAHLDHNGKWVESPRTNYIYHGPAPLPPEELALPEERGSSRTAERGYSALRQPTALISRVRVPQSAAKKKPKAKKKGRSRQDRHPARPERSRGERPKGAEGPLLRMSLRDLSDGAKNKRNTKQTPWRAPAARRRRLIGTRGN